MRQGFLDLRFHMENGEGADSYKAILSYSHMGRKFSMWASVHLAGAKGSHVGSSALVSQSVEALGPLRAPPCFVPTEDLVHWVAGACVSSHTAQTVCASIRWC